MRELQRKTGTMIKLPEEGVTKADETPVLIMGPIHSVMVILSSITSSVPKKEERLTKIHGDSVAWEFPADDVKEASAGNGRAQSSVPTFFDKGSILCILYMPISQA